MLSSPLSMDLDPQLEPNVSESVPMDSDDLVPSIQVRKEIHASATICFRHEKV